MAIKANTLAHLGLGEDLQIPTVYTVQPGDSLTGIAQRLGYCQTNKTVAGAQVCLGVAKVIARTNGIEDINRIQPGQQLVLPPNLNSVPPATPGEVQATADGQSIPTDGGSTPAMTTDVSPSPKTVGVWGLLAGAALIGAGFWAARR